MDSKYQLAQLAEGASETTYCYYKTENAQQDLIQDHICLVQDTDLLNGNTCSCTCTRFCCIYEPVKCIEDHITIGQPDHNRSEKLGSIDYIHVITAQPKALLPPGNNVQESENSQVLESLMEKKINDAVNDKLPENLKQKATNNEVNDKLPENLRQKTTNDVVDDKEVSKEQPDNEVTTEQSQSLAAFENNLQQIGNPQLLDNQRENQTNNEAEAIAEQSKLISAPEDNVQVSAHHKVQENISHETISDDDTEVSKEKALKKYVYFWKGEDLYSQWHPSQFCVEGRTFSCAEQYMMYQKAVLFDDQDSKRKIMATKDPRTMKSLGRKVKRFNCDIWLQHCLYIVKEGNKNKFSQNSELKNELYSTYPKVLVEASPYDTVWGIGHEQDDFMAWDERTWDGKNWLGYMITEVRDELMCTDKIIEAHQCKIYLEQLLSKSLTQHCTQCLRKVVIWGKLCLVMPTLLELV